jgi:2-C-methyl-D-erythritol 2,4-cyclodiphosphate synthase
MRVAQGFDVHRFSDDVNRPLWLGLVQIPGAPGLSGHSDADVVTHALCDALLGSANLGDLGHHFPDTDENLKNVDSRQLLESSLSMVRSEGYRVLSGDITIVAEQPKLAPYIGAMSNELSSVLGVIVSLKATTAEGLGALGRGEGISASAIVLVEETP